MHITASAANDCVLLNPDVARAAGEEMKEDAARTRREFLSGAGSALGVTWIAAQWPAIAAAHAHAAAVVADGGSIALAFFTPADARDVDAIAAQIIPTDDAPGAREAGALYFIDRSLYTWLAPQGEIFRGGLREFQEKFAAAHSGVAFAAAGDATQLAYLSSNDQSEFFQSVRALTLIGLFALPQYGGNRDGMGWRLIGFEDQHVFAPPFGYYDRDYPGFMPHGAKR
jgi:gluconate 2-dehydrogenase gamma chain